MNMALHAHTPALVAIDPRGLAIRSIAFCRREQNQPVDERVTHQFHDAAGRLVSQRDPRLVHCNLNTTYSLSAQMLFSDSVDAGWRLGLLGDANQVVERWDGRGSQRLIEYDELLRPLAITEQMHVTERFSYAGPDAFEHNQCGRLIRHDDTAGTRYIPDHGLLGTALSEVRQFLSAVETPDWPLAEHERDALLETISLQTQWTFNALGEAIAQTDAMGHTQHFRQTVAGQLKAVDLTLDRATQPQTLVSEILYNAFDQVEQETAGNGVASHSLYDPQDGRLMERNAERLQHLKYAYDPAGNILQIEDTAQPVRFFSNQRVEPISRYTYDTLYQLVEATGREVNTGVSHGPALPDLQNLPADPNQVSNYTQSYDYDSAGNLLQMRHVGAQVFTRTMCMAPDSNRSLPEGETDADFETGFDVNGNQLQLVRGQALEWDLRNQLQQIITVTRTTKASDHERYIYDGQGLRCRKINNAQASNRILISEVRYLPGLEIRTTADGEILHVISAHNIRILHWQTGLPAGIANDQTRYNLSDHLGSNTLELDQQGNLITQESYYPFGGTSWWATRSAVQAKYKTVRYSGKERDAGGLYYYGFRYYAPWLQRWINPDPAGDVEGLNLFCFVANSPIMNNDLDGRMYSGRGDPVEDAIEAQGHTILYRGLSDFPEGMSNALEKGFENTHIIYENALYMIKLHPEESASIMRSFFGIRYHGVTPDIIRTWEDNYLRAAEYRGEQGERNIVGIRSNIDRLTAFVFQEDPLGRIIIDTRHIEQETLPLTIGHELSHLKNVIESPVVTPGTQDYYYLLSSQASALTSDKNTFNHHDYRTVAEMITGGGLTPQYFSMFSTLGNAFTSQVKALHPAPESITDLQSAITGFNQNPDIIASMSADNADSLIHAAYHLNLLYKKNLSQQLATRH
ncbi:hypothetical protein ALQ04_01562 [Pseudomonas cichorii]|uniref:YD repeat-containing protein n=1 Tax=Pseudomonas cichorii TaxID=36746 RepID=A0A3M4LX42_PSECI|nr:RHS repeat-associated core domain-containing protein [Pseudomonas cichorii]RMQ45714.1 hypothetical protein ALQ04_01562 [Pseudomonas cichorii]